MTVDWKGAMTVEWAKLKFNPAELAWFVHSDGDVELSVPGDAEGPEAAHLAFARRVTPHLGGMNERAQKHLDYFADTARLDARDSAYDRDIRTEGRPSEWELRWVEFGRAPDAAGTDIDLYYVRDSDTYGLWSVRFGGNDWMRDTPCQFTRRFW